MTLYNTTGISEKRFSEAECLGDRVGGFIKNHRRTLSSLSKEVQRVAMNQG